MPKPYIDPEIEAKEFLEKQADLMKQYKVELCAKNAVFFSSQRWEIRIPFSDEILTPDRILTADIYVPLAK